MIDSAISSGVSPPRSRPIIAEVQAVLQQRTAAFLRDTSGPIHEMEQIADRKADSR